MGILSGKGLQYEVEGGKEEYKSGVLEWHTFKGEDYTEATLL